MSQIKTVSNFVSSECDLVRECLSQVTGSVHCPSRSASVFSWLILEESYELFRGTSKTANNKRVSRKSISSLKITEVCCSNLTNLASLQFNMLINLWTLTLGCTNQLPLNCELPLSMRLRNFTCEISFLIPNILVFIKLPTL